MKDEVLFSSESPSGLAAAGIAIPGLAVFICALLVTLTRAISVEWLLLSLVTVVCISRIGVMIPGTRARITVTDGLIFASVILYGVGPSIVLAGVDAAVCSLGHRVRRLSILFNTGLMSISILGAGIIALELSQYTYGPLWSAERLFLACALLSLVHYLINSGLAALVTALREKKNLLETWRESYLWSWLSYLIGGVAAFLIVVMVPPVSYYAFIAALPLIAITYLAYSVYFERIEYTINRAEKMVQLHLNTLEALAVAIQAKDENTQSHIRRLQIYALGVAGYMGLTGREREALQAGVLLHDIGKLAVPDYILNKPGPLTQAEFEKIKLHSTVGAEILSQVDFPYPVVPVVRYHHERWDGLGYPEGLRREEIPLPARILAVVDSYNSAIQERSYRKSLSRQQALDMLREESGKAFDPAVVDVFLDHIGEFEEEIRRCGLDLTPIGGEEEKTTGTSNNYAIERIRSAHREITALYGMAQSVGASLDVGYTFTVFSSRLLEIIPYTTCILYRIREEPAAIEASQACGASAEFIRGRKMAPGAGIAGWVAANRRSMYNCDPRLDFDAIRIQPAEQYQAAVVVPLIKDSSVHGAFGVYSADLPSYDLDQIRVIEAAAGLLSDHLANALRHEKIEETALTDALTGLANARALRRRFEDEANRAGRRGESFTVVMMDVDGFKQVNDRLGHHEGDRVLKDVAAAISGQVRSSDFLSRYAGDEFVAILLVTPEDSPELVSRIQKSVDDHDFGFSRHGLKLGLSAGWACFKSPENSLDELLLAADRNMYLNKAERKAAAPAVRMALVRSEGGAK